jgi:hypothetical protein
MLCKPLELVDHARSLREISDWVRNADFAWQPRLLVAVPLSQSGEFIEEEWGTYFIAERKQETGSYYQRRDWDR